MEKVFIGVLVVVFVGAQGVSTQRALQGDWLGFWISAALSGSALFAALCVVKG